MFTKTLYSYTFENHRVCVQFQGFFKQSQAPPSQLFNWTQATPLEHYLLQKLIVMPNLLWGFAHKKI